MDSAALMRLAQTLGTRQGIVRAALMIGSPSNRRLMQDAGLLAEAGGAAGANDLIIALRAHDSAAGEAGLADAEAILDGPNSAGQDSGQYRPGPLYAAPAMPGGAHAPRISGP